MTFECPTQFVATNGAAAALAGGSCVAINAAPGTGDMLATALTIQKGVRVLLLTFCFEDATTITVRKTVSGGAVADMALFEGNTFAAGALYTQVACPVEEGDTINFRLGTNNNGAKTRMFKVEGAGGR